VGQLLLHACEEAASMCNRLTYCHEFPLLSGSHSVAGYLHQSSSGNNLLQVR